MHKEKRTRAETETTGLKRQTPTPSQKTNAEAHRFNQVIRKNMQEVFDTRTMKCQNMEEFEVSRSKRREGLGVVMKDSEVDTG